MAAVADIISTSRTDLIRGNALTSGEHAVVLRCVLTLVACEAAGADALAARACALVRAVLLVAITACRRLAAWRCAADTILRESVPCRACVI